MCAISAAAVAASAGFFFLAMMEEEERRVKRRRTECTAPVPRPLTPACMDAVDLWALHQANPGMFRSWHRMTIYEMHHLVQLLPLPAEIRLPRARGGYVCSPIVALAMYLRHLSFPSRLDDMTMEFGGGRSRVSAIIIHFGELLYNAVGEGLVFNMETMVERAPLYSRAIMLAGNVYYPRVIGFMDASLRVICQPSRYQQEAVTDGNETARELKIQTVVTPDGLISCAYGPAARRLHDAFLCDYSRLDIEHMHQLNRRLDEELGPGHVHAWEPNLFANQPYSIYGDGAYRGFEYIVHPFIKPRNGQLPATFKRINTAMSRVRTSCAEVGHKLLSSLWHQLCLRSHQKVLLSPIETALVNAIFLTNCVTCARGGNQIIDLIEDEAGEAVELPLKETLDLDVYVQRVTGHVADNIAPPPIPMPDANGPEFAGMLPEIAGLPGAFRTAVREMYVQYQAQAAQAQAQAPEGCP